MADCQKIFNSKIEARSVNAGLTILRLKLAFHLQLFGCKAAQTLIVIDTESCQRSFSSFYDLRLGSEVATLFFLESERTPFSWKGRLFRSAALHRTRLGTSKSVPMP